MFVSFSGGIIIITLVVAAMLVGLFPLVRINSQNPSQNMGELF